MARLSTPCSSRVPKRKRESEASIHRQVAKKLDLFADANDSLNALQLSLQRQFVRYNTQKSQAHELRCLHVAVEQLIHFQTLFGMEINDETMRNPQVMSLQTQMDKLLAQISNKKKPLTHQIKKMGKTLPQLIKNGSCIVTERRQWLREQKELPARHQWVPMVLWKIYEETVEVAEKNVEKKRLKNAMHKVMKAIQVTNPYFYLQVLYQPPPSNVCGKWEVEASEKLMEVTAGMTPYFRALKRRSFALSDTRDSSVRIHYGWNQLRVTLAFARRAARHFHFLILHLYALAMGCDVSNVHAGIISEKAAKGIISDDQELRAELGLCRDCATSEEILVKETFEWTPELLIFVDEWRWHGRWKFGFDRREQHRDFLPRFTVNDRPKRSKARCDALGEIGYNLRVVERQWKKSRLGTTGFTSMRIEEIGDLEKRIKGGLGAVVDVVYKMMLARWMDRRKRPDKWWASLELREKLRQNPDQDFQVDLPEPCLLEYSEAAQAEIAEGTMSEATANKDMQDATDAESVEHKEVRKTRVHLPAEGNFRQPTTVKLRELGLTEETTSASQHSPEEPTMQELQESARDAHHHVAKVLSYYNGEHSTEWRNTILSKGLGTVHLLRVLRSMILRGEAAH